MLQSFRHSHHADGNISRPHLARTVMLMREQAGVQTEYTCDRYQGSVSCRSMSASYAVAGCLFLSDISLLSDRAIGRIGYPAFLLFPFSRTIVRSTNPRASGLGFRVLCYRVS